MDKVCKIINSQFSYILEVDGMKIPFDYMHNSDYFEKHYSELGYKIEKIDDYIKE
jgi:metal-dependent hydrolase (beta-lactamase superfamily II)